MKYVKIAGALLLGIIGFFGIVFLIAGILVPSERSCTQETIIDSSPEVIWSVLTDREKFPEWQKDLKSVKITGSNTWIGETKEAGSIDFTVIRSEKPTSLDLKYSKGSWMQGGWSGRLKQIDNGKTVITTTDKTIAGNWPMKIMMSMFFNIGDFASDWNKSLKDRAEAISKNSN